MTHVLKTLDVFCCCCLKKMRRICGTCKNYSKTYLTLQLFQFLRLKIQIVVVGLRIVIRLWYQGLHWEWIFLRDSNSYLRDFWRKPLKTPNGLVDKHDPGLNLLTPVYQLWGQNCSATGGALIYRLRKAFQSAFLCVLKVCKDFKKELWLLLKKFEI